MHAIRKKARYGPHTHAAGEIRRKGVITAGAPCCKRVKDGGVGEALSNQRSKPLEVRDHLSKRREGSEMLQ